MVLTQLISEFKEYARDFMFPYHYGSYATIFNGEIEVSLPKFPYHYGSYKSSPPLTVQEHGPVHRKDQRSDPEQELFGMTK